MLGVRCLARCGTLLFAAALAAGGWGTAAGAQPDPAAARNGRRQPGFTVATYNVNWGNVDLRQTVDVLRKAEADLVLLQETEGKGHSTSPPE